MDISHWLLFNVYSCILLVALSAAKTFSLNDAIAAESEKLKTADVRISRTPTPNTSGQRFSLNKYLTSDSSNKIHKSEKSATRKLLPYKHKTEYRNLFKSNKLRDIFRPLHFRKNLSKKRETSKYEKFDQKYLPLLKNVRSLLDNLLHSGTADSYEISKSKSKRLKYLPGKRNGVVCKCSKQPDTETGESRSHKKTAVLTKAEITEIETTSTPTPDTSLGNFIRFRQNKNLSLLLPRDSFSDRGDSDGHNERSSSTLHRSFKGDIARNIRNRKHNSGIRNVVSSTESNEKFANGNSRNRTGSDESARRRNRGNVSVDRSATIEGTNSDYDEKVNEIIRGVPLENFSRENKLKIGRDKAKSEEFLSNHIRRFRRPVPKSEDSIDKESIQSKENDEESFNNVILNDTSNKRVADRDSATSTEDKEASPRHENMISAKDLSNLTLALQKNHNIKTSSVTIIDGYSVASDKNGQNKLSEKSIHIHT